MEKKYQFIYSSGLVYIGLTWVGRHEIRCIFAKFHQINCPAAHPCHQAQRGWLSTICFQPHLLLFEQASTDWSSYNSIAPKVVAYTWWLTIRQGAVVWLGWGRGWYGGPVQIACSGVELNEVQPSSSPRWSMRDLINQPFISQLSKHVSVCHHGCYWFLIWEDQIGNVL